MNEIIINKGFCLICSDEKKTDVLDTAIKIVYNNKFRKKS